MHLQFSLLSEIVPENGVFKRNTVPGPILSKPNFFSELTIDPFESSERVFGTVTFKK